MQLPVLSAPTPTASLTRETALPASILLTPPPFALLPTATPLPEASAAESIPAQSNESSLPTTKTTGGHRPR